MKLILKILFFILALFHTNISESKTIVFEGVTSEIKYTASDIGIENESSVILENDFGITYKSESNLVGYRNLVLHSKTTFAQTSLLLLDGIFERRPSASGGFRRT